MRDWIEIIFAAIITLIIGIVFGVSVMFSFVIGICCGALIVQSGLDKFRDK